MLVFTGSYVDGLTTSDGQNVDLAYWAGLTDLTEDEHDRLSELSDLEVLESCAYADFERDEFESDFPGESDTFVKVSARDVDQLKAEVREILRSHLDDRR